MLEVAVRMRRGAFALDARFRADAPIVALFGRSGSGKTTLIEAIAGLARPDDGRTNPSKQRIVVVFPAPFGPRNP